MLGIGWRSGHISSLFCGTNSGSDVDWWFSKPILLYNLASTEESPGRSPLTRHLRGCARQRDLSYVLRGSSKGQSPQILLWRAAPRLLRNPVPGKKCPLSISISRMPRSRCPRTPDQNPIHVSIDLPAQFHTFEEFATDQTVNGVC